MAANKPKALWIITEFILVALKVRMFCRKILAPWMIFYCLPTNVNEFSLLAKFVNAIM